MSYLFSETKNAGASSSAKRLGSADLSLRARIILAWMLMVELLRKKVDVIHMSSYSGIIQRAGRVIWLGNLVFFNIENPGRKAVFSILWILCATKLVQRIAFTEVGKRSYAHGKNAWLISSYMVQMLQHNNNNDHQDHLHLHADDVEQAAHLHVGNEELLKRCKYIVMGEEKLVEATTADGYKIINPPDGSVITVGKVWELGEDNKLFTYLHEKQHLKRLSLSFALFKLLRQRFEHLPAMTDGEAHYNRDIILRGIYNNDERSAEALFQVMNDELAFLGEYYHSVVPVVLASPIFLLVNYFLLHIVVIILCLMTIILCGNGDVRYAFTSIRTDNYTLEYGIANIITCLESRIFSTSFHIITWLRSKMIHNNLRFKQFSALNHRCPVKLLPLFGRLSFVLKTEVVPNNLKQSITEYLVEHERRRGSAGYGHLTNGKSALERNNLSSRLLWACNRDSVAEVILTWHIATTILEVKCAPQTIEEVGLSRVATRLSKYCAYLVAFHPDLLPDYQEKAELVFQDMTEELKGMLGSREYYLSSLRVRVDKILEITQVEEARDETRNQVGTTGQSDEYKVVMNATKLCRSLMPESNNGLEIMWKVLADVWTELIVFMAPSNNEERLKGHEEVLIQGGEFITVLWALTTHIGISRSSLSKSVIDGHPEA
ncbi:hypothetical protein HU200_015027 [Digitaria exilis]|uniref:DUF4220 domain-containing protein n=1 Tax=Digitaria exilis TaxID=1010633 RepID=A0A835FAM9_9POAL|nr:hypothetical protein HU200_015027 [Digitaria exilis]